MTTSPFRGVIFDKDGTLFDLQATWGAFAGAFLRDLAGADTVLLATLAEVAGYDLATARLRPGSVIAADTPADLADALLPFLPLPPSRGALIERMNRAAAAAPMVEAAPLVPLLDTLRQRGMALGVVTNDAEAPARAHLSAAGIIDRFGFIAGYDSGFGRKPGPGQLIAFAAHHGLPSETVLMVGDSLHDLMAGRAAGMATVGVLTGLAGPRELAPLADALLPDIGALIPWLDASPG